MSTAALLVNTSGTGIAADRIQQFRTTCRGAVICPDDAAYDAARRIWNASIDKRPGLIIRCTGVADVIAAVNFARDHDLRVAVRGGGHNVAGRALCDGGLVIDLSGMKGIHVDTRHRRVRVQPGVTLGDLDRETHVYGLAVPTGVVSKTGIAGLTLGGGVGWLSRKYGLTVDNVLSFELVAAEGQVVTASATENPDLFWALRGGGGNFGVVTSFEYQAHPVGKVLGGLILYPRSQAVDVLKFYRDFTRTAPDELGAYAGLLSAPDGTPVAALVICYCGDLGEGERVVAPLRSISAPLLDAVQPIAFPVMQSSLDAAVPDGNQNYWKSAFLRDLSDPAIEMIVRHADQASSPRTAVLVEQYGGAAGRVPSDATAFAHRDTDYDLGILTQWVDPTESERHIAWTREFANAMEPFRTGAYLLNFLGEEGDEVVRAAFGTNYARLAKVKAQYDPTNFFQVNQNITPAASA